MILEAKALIRKPVNYSAAVSTNLEKSKNSESGIGKENENDLTVKLVDCTVTELDSSILGNSKNPEIEIKNDDSNNIFEELLNMSFSTAQGVHDAVSTELRLNFNFL